MPSKGKRGLVPREALAKRGFRQLHQPEEPRATWGDRKPAYVLGACLSCPVPWDSLHPGWCGEPLEPGRAAGGW